jgi:hypothetical protein
LANHNKPPQGAAPKQAKRAATAGGAGKAAKAAGKTNNTGAPKPKAKATLPQVPEPKPAKLLLGRKLAGAAPKGKATKKPPPAATQCTKRAERAAKAAGRKGGCTRNTNADPKAERTRLSTPQAQPTPTAPENPATEGKKARHEDTAKEPATREPEKATQGKEPTKEAKDTITHLKKINAKKTAHEVPATVKGGLEKTASYHPCRGGANAHFCIYFFFNVYE